MKKNLLLLICLLITVINSAQEVNRKLDIKSLQQRLNIQTVPFNPASFQNFTVKSEGTVFKCDSMFEYSFTSTNDSILDGRYVWRFNSEGFEYFSYLQYPRYDVFGKSHAIQDTMGNVLSRCGKGEEWSWKSEFSYDTIGNQIQGIDFTWSNGNWNITSNWMRYYSTEIPDPKIIYDWYGWGGWGAYFRNEEGFRYAELRHDTLFIGDIIDPFTGPDTKILRKYDQMGVITCSEGYVWSNVENKWVQSSKEEFLHGPSGLDTLYRGFLWNKFEKTWDLEFVDTIIRDENGNCIDYKMTKLNYDDTELILLRRFVAEYDSENRLLDIKHYGESSSVNDLKTYSEHKFVYDINGNEILHSYFQFQNEIVKFGYKENFYYSPLEISTDASLWDVSFTGGDLRAVINDVISPTAEIFNDEINKYYVFLSDTVTIVPQIEFIKNDPNSSVVVSDAINVDSENKEDRTTIVTVTAEDGSTTQDYFFEFHLFDHIVTLDTLWLNEGELWPAFSKDIFTYYDTIHGGCVSSGTTPVVNYITSSPFASATLRNAANICSPNFNKTIITVKADDGNTKTYQIIFLLTDIKNIKSNDLKIYPNPVTNLLKLEHSTPIMEITLFNMLGQEVESYDLDSVLKYEISLTGLSKGVYFIRIKDNGGQVYTRKVIKE